MRLKIVASTLLFTVICLGGAVGESESIDLNLYLQDISRAQPPRLFGDFIILTCAPRAPTRLVGARFSHEDFRIFHPFRKNENGVYVLALSAPAGSQTVLYRFMIDGVWTIDHANPLRDTDAGGITFSVFHYTRTVPVVALAAGPRLLGDGLVEFSLTAESGSVVAIAGDFNAYDPFTHRLEESSPGLFTIRLRLLPGRHYYCFMVNGVHRTDPLNDRVAADADRLPYSIFDVR